MADLGGGGGGGGGLLGGDAAGDSGSSLQNWGNGYINAPPGPTPPELPAAPAPLPMLDGTQATWGTAIPQSFGFRMVQGVVLWASDPRRDAPAPPPLPPPVVGVPSGGGGYGPNLSRDDGSGDSGKSLLNWPDPVITPPPEVAGIATLTNPGVVLVDFAVAFGYSCRPPDERSSTRLIKLYADGVLFYGDNSTGQPQTMDGLGIEFHPGLANADPDPTIRDAMGANTPAFRDMIYVTVRNFPLLENKPKLPVVRALISDDSAEPDPTWAAFATNNTIEGDGGAFVDRSVGAYYGFSTPYFNATHRLHEFDMYTDSELRNVVLNGVPLGVYLNVGQSGWTVFDPDNKLVLFQHGGAIGNRMPIATVRVDNGQVIDSFGVEDTSLSSDANGQSITTFAGMMKYRAFGLQIFGLCSAGIFGNFNFMGYKHSPKIVPALAGSYMTLDRGGQVDPSDFSLEWDATVVMPNNVTALLPYPVLDRPELKQSWHVDQSDFQDFVGLIADGNTISVVTAGLKLTTTLAVTPVAEFTVRDGYPRELVQVQGTFVTEMFIDETDGSLMVISQIGAGNVDKYLSRYRIQWGSTPFGITINSMYAVYVGIVLTNYNTDAIRQGIKQMDTASGAFGYMDSAGNFRVYQLSSGRKLFEEDLGFGGVSDDFFFDWSTRSLVVSRGEDSKVTRISLFGDLTGATVLLTDFLRWSALKLGYAADEITLEDIPDTVIGGLMDSPTPVRQTLTTLSLIYDFAVVEHGGTIKFVRKARGELASPVALLTREDTSPLSETSKDSVKTTVAAPDDVPADVSIEYLDPTMDYSKNTQIFKRVRFPFETVKTKRTADYHVPFIMTPDDALTRAARIVYSSFAQAIVYEWRLPQRFIKLQPSDIVTLLDRDGTPTLIQVTQLTYNAEWSMSFGGLNWSSNENIPLPTFSPLGNRDPALRGPSDSIPLVFDIPIIYPDENVPGSLLVYTGVGSLGQSWWKSGSMVRQIDDAPRTTLYQTSMQTPYGATDIALPDTAATDTTFQTDETTVLTVVGRTLDTTSMATATDEDTFRAGQNAALIGRPGRWELVFYRTVTVVDAHKVTISGLLRGRRGTDVFVSAHEAGDLFVPFTGVNLKRGYLNADAIGKRVSFQAVGVNTTKAGRIELINPVGNSHKPWAVAQVEARLGVGINAFSSPNYLNDMGGGGFGSETGLDRRFGCTVTGVSISRPTLLVDGDPSNNTSHSAEFVNAATNGSITYDFRLYGFRQRVTEFQWNQSTGATQGNWVFEGSNDGLSWIGIEAATALATGSGPTTHTLTNPDYYWFYRQRETTGSLSSSPWLQEVYFKTHAEIDDDDVILTWLRRDRLAPSTDWLTVSQPLTEDVEAYEVDIINPATGLVVRTIENITTARTFYRATDQVTDGFTPTLGSVTVRIYQISALVGRGLYTEHELELA